MASAATQAKWDHFEVLDVKRDATREQIRKAYYALMLTHHPDKQGSENGVSDSSEMAVRLNQAYEVLVDETRKAAYLAALPPTYTQEVPKEASASAKPEAAAPKQSTRYPDATRQPLGKREPSQSTSGPGAATQGDLAGDATKSSKKAVRILEPHELRASYATTTGPDGRPPRFPQGYYVVCECKRYMSITRGRLKASHRTLVGHSCGAILSLPCMPEENPLQVVPLTSFKLAWQKVRHSKNGSFASNFVKIAAFWERPCSCTSYFRVPTARIEAGANVVKCTGCSKHLGIDVTA